ncbi:MAG: ATP-binding protein [Limnohabitans sp.]|nr:ATP-binding protein [Limnohabitans sp.]
MNEIFEIEKLLSDAHSIRINSLSKSIEITQQALLLSEESNNKPLIAKSLSQLALYKMVVGEMELATQYAKKSISIFFELNDEKGLADAQYSLAGVYYKTNEYHLGLINFTEALKIYRKHNDFYNQSRTEKSLGTIYEFIGDTSNAFTVYKNAVKNAKKINDSNLVSNVYNNVSGILVKNGRLGFAMKLINESIKLKKQTNDIRGMAYALYGKAKVYSQLNENIKAEDFFFKALEIHQKMGENTGITMTYTKLGELYLKMNDLKKALEYALKGYDLANSLKLSMSTIKLNKLIYLIYKKEENSEKALHYLEQHLKEKESVINSQTLKVIENYEMIDKKKSLEKKAELQKQKQELLKKQNRDELENYRKKQEFLSIMSHEIRTPLNAITSTISLLDDEVSKEGKIMLNNLKFASNNLINIVNDVLDFNKLDTNNSKLECSSTNLNFLCQNSIEVFNRLANEKNIELGYVSNISTDTNYLIDQTKVGQILNNLISNAITSTISLLDDEVSKEGKIMLNNLKFASNNLINIVNDVLDFNKLDTNNSKLECSSTNLNFLCQNSIEVFNRLANEKNIELGYVSNISTDTNYLIDQTKVGQILNNLISNAIKFTEKGKVKLEIKLIESIENKDKIFFAITDTGEGIPETDIFQIFNTFTQLKPYLTRKQGGTGLGLAIVKKLIELHDSQIFVESKLGKGSKFYFELELEKTQKSIFKVIKHNELKGKKALIVDDTKMNAILLKKLLLKWEIETEYAESGKLALKYAENKVFDFILMDIHMPEMNGLEVSKKIRTTQNYNSSTPIFAITADILADTQEDFNKYFSGIIFKPFETEKLYDLLLHSSFSNNGDF